MRNALNTLGISIVALWGGLFYLAMAELFFLDGVELGYLFTSLLFPADLGQSLVTIGINLFAFCFMFVERA